MCNDTSLYQDLHLYDAWWLHILALIFLYTCSETSLRQPCCGPVRTGLYREVAASLRWTVMLPILGAREACRLAVIESWLYSYGVNIWTDFTVQTSSPQVVSTLNVSVRLDYVIINIYTCNIIY